MCVGLPARVIRLGVGRADVDTGQGRTLTADIATTENINEGDYVLLYANLIIEKIDRRSALETLRYMKGMAAAAAKEDGFDASLTTAVFTRRARRLTAPPRRRE
jgi:hydrogenase assembly chaperone HypC/HupF